MSSSAPVCTAPLDEQILKYRAPKNVSPASRSPLGAEDSTPQTSVRDINFFSHLPPYAPPDKGCVSWLPASWIPYAQLMRLDRSAGFYAYFVPYLTGLVYAACIAPQAPSLSTFLYYAVLLVPFSVLMRGIACTWNDTVDQEFDRRVERCRHRPIARGAVSTSQAHLFTLAQLAVTYPFLTFLFPAECLVHAALTVFLFLIYSLLKRITYYPQVFLGLPISWGIPFSVTTLNLNPLKTNPQATLALFTANILWTIIFDTIYAHQDIEDDAKAGVKGMALRFQNTTKHLATLLAAAQISCLYLCGYSAAFGLPYYVGTVGGVAAALASYIYCVDLKRPESCGAWFYWQFLLVGAAFFAGLFGEYCGRGGVGGGVLN